MTAAAGAAAALSGVLPGPAGAAGRRRVRTTTERHRVVIIGSGFGGSIAAFRLAEAGVPSVILERGRRWPIQADGKTFPHFLTPDRRASYLTPTPVFPGQPPVVYRPYTGLYERIGGQGTDVLNGACVGGGSVVYAGVWLRPREETFTQVMPASVSFSEMDAVYYPRAFRRAGVSPLPDDVLAHERYATNRLWIDHAGRAGLPVERAPLAIDWDVVRAELAGRAVPSASIGEYLCGVNSGARLSLDRNYLGWAEASGLATVRPLHRVTEVGLDRQGRYVITAERIDTDGDVLERTVFVADALFLGAGSSGTSKLLVEARERQTLPGLNEHVGAHWGNNGTRVYVRTMVPEPTGTHQGGPMCVCIRDFDNPLGPVTIEFGPFPFPVESHAMATPGFSLCEPAGRWVADPHTGAAMLRWPVDGDVEGQRAVRGTLSRLVAATGGPPAGPDLFRHLGPVADELAKAGGGPGAGLLATIAAAPAGLVDASGITPVTFHPLGGAVIDQACDTYGRVHGHRGLYVTDGALIPGSTGACNPVWTISALAERCMDDILARDVGTVF